MTDLIAVTIGDIDGIGIDILIKAWKQKKIKNFVLFCNKEILKKYILKRNIKIKINQYNFDKKNKIYKENCLNYYSFKSNNREENTLKSIRYSYDECRKNIFIGMVTLPLRKDIIISKVNSNFSGHTEYLQKLDKKKYSNMIMFHNKIIISTITTHIKLNSIVKKISEKNFLYNQIININKTLINDFGIKKPKLIISGLNPHAGENGHLGREEIDIIIPTIKRIKKKKINIDGPKSGDSLIIKSNIKSYDCFIFIFHDQALIPFKYISNFTGVNYTGNLDIIRTSPDHGTAYNLINSNKVSNISLLKCFELIKKIKNNRKKNENSQKIIKSKFH